MNDTKEQVIDNNENGAQPPRKNKKVRERKKALYKEVAKQMEIYFGDSNLLQDRFLKKLIDSSEDGYVPLDVFLKFNKIRHFHVGVDDIAKSITHFSTLLAINDRKDKIMRTTPLATQEDLDARTVYVEGIPLTANHEWVISTLSKYDKVNYVSLPKYSTTKNIKGFAFVEFASIAGAKSCLSAIGTKEFSSVHPFPKAGSKDIQRMERSVAKASANDAPLPKKKGKKRHSASTDTLVTDESSGKSGAQVANAKNDSDAVKDASTGDCSTAKDDNPSEEPLNKKPKLTQTEPPTKISKKRKRKSSHSKSKDEPAAKVADLDSETDTQSMKSSVKAEAKRPKNEHTTPKKDSVKKECAGPLLRAISKAEWLLLKKQYLDIQKGNMASLKQKLREQKVKEQATAHNVELLDLIPNVVIGIKADGEMDRAKVKNCIPEDIAVTYIDIPVGSTSGFIRCKSCEDASELLKQTCGENYELYLLQGEAENSYWGKINQQRLDKRTNKTKTKRATNKKGTQKVLEQQKKQAKKAQKNMRVLFDDDE